MGHGPLSLAAVGHQGQDWSSWAQNLFINFRFRVHPHFRRGDPKELESLRLFINTFGPHINYVL